MNASAQPPSALMQQTARSRVKRVRDRASYELARVYQLVDELKTAHIGFSRAGQVFVIPMTVWRVEQHLYFHVMNKSRLQKILEDGQQICLSIAETREWVLSKSAYHHSANYRSAVLYCGGERVVDEDEFDRVFAVITNQLEAGRWDKVRPPNKKERKATALMKLTILDGSYKARTGGPNEEPEDLDLPVWHGTIPVCPARHSA